jgi:hypothetical protein
MKVAYLTILTLFLAISINTLKAQEIDCDEIPYDISQQLGGEYLECFVNDIFKEDGQVSILKMMYDGPDGDFIAIIETEGPPINDVFINGSDGENGMVATHYVEGRNGCYKEVKKWTKTEQENMEARTIITIEGYDGVFESAECK